MCPPRPATACRALLEGHRAGCGKVNWGPGGAWQAAQVEEVWICLFALALGEADSDACGQTDRSRHSRVGARELLAVADLGLEEELLQRVAAVAGADVEGVPEGPQVVLEHEGLHGGRGGAGGEGDGERADPGAEPVAIGRASGGREVGREV